MADYKADTLDGSEHIFREFRFEIQECSFDNDKKQTRASLTIPDYKGKYIHTVALKDVWENAHYHKKQNEIYILEKGKAVLVVLELGKPVPYLLAAGLPFTLTAGEHHKVWMQEEARMHAVKAATTNKKAASFTLSEELDELCKNVGLDRLLADAAPPQHRHR